MTDILQSCAILAVALAVVAQAISIKRLHEDIARLRKIVGIVVERQMEMAERMGKDE